MSDISTVSDSTSFNREYQRVPTNTEYDESSVGSSIMNNSEKQINRGIILKFKKQLLNNNDIQSVDIILGDICEELEECLQNHEFENEKNIIYNIKPIFSNSKSLLYDEKNSHNLKNKDASVWVTLFDNWKSVALMRAIRLYIDL